ncbi:tetratricopeptide repeat protein [Sinosporangium album]|uniref:tetratricopeptide repeat protein n=1 Tax=Sinosporangium album TaxID=504805 RepID=UPI0015A29DC0|nr:tetratricopeptide repeat protein [Sinosporangium album]
MGREEDENSKHLPTNEIAGTISGAAVQAEAIYGDVHIKHIKHIDVESSPRAVPAQLGPAPSVFVDREAEQAKLQRLFTEKPHAPNSPQLFVISGLGGVGKSSLALHWLHQIRHLFTDGQLYADLRGFSHGGDPTQPTEVLERFLRALGIAPDRIPTQLDEQVATYRSVTAGQRIVVMLDNAISAAQVRLVLPAATESLVLATTRKRLTGLMLDDARFVELTPLSEDAAVDLLTRVLGAERITAEPDAAADLVGLCGRLPLAVWASAARLALRPRWSIERLVTELSDAARRLSGLSTDDMHVKAVFDVSYQALPPDQARLYRALGLHPGEEFGSQVAAAALNIDVEEAEELLDGLVAASLLEERKGDGFGFHDLLRLHAHEAAMATDTPDLRRDILARIAGWYLDRAVAADLVVLPGRWHVGPRYREARQRPAEFDERGKALHWLESALPTLAALVKATHLQGLHGLCWQLCESLWGLFISRKHYEIWLQTHAFGLASAKVEGPPLAVARMQLALAAAHLDLRDFSRAALLCEAAIEQSRVAENEVAEASAWGSLGLARLQEENPDQAITCFQRALTMHERAEEMRGAALAIRYLGEAYRAAGVLDEAERHFLNAYDYFQRHDDEHNQARTLTGLGQTYVKAGRLREAAGRLDAALVLSLRLGSRRQEAEVRVAQADLLEKKGDIEGCRMLLPQALAIYDELRAPGARQIRERLDALSGADQPNG